METAKRRNAGGASSASRTTHSTTEPFAVANGFHHSIQHEALNPQIHCERNQSSGFLLMLSGLIHWQQMVHWLSGSGSC